MTQRSTNPGDIVLIHLHGKPASFARIEAVRPHDRRGWYYCDLLILAAPPQAVSWILERAQIDGAEFTMGGRGVRIERIPEIGALHGGPRAGAPVADRERRATPAPARFASVKLSSLKAPPRPVGRKEKTKPSREVDGNVVRLFPRKSPA